MSLKFLLAIELIMSPSIEGGYVNDPNDSGGETKYGISKRAFPEEDIKSLTKQRAREIYKEHYWDKIEGDKLPDRLSVCVLDSAINQGVGTAAKLLQEAVDAKIDGIIGTNTIRRVYAYQQDWLIDEYMYLRKMRYLKTENYSIYGKGWTRRLFTVCRNSERMNLISNMEKE